MTRDPALRVYYAVGCPICRHDRTRYERRAGAAWPAHQSEPWPFRREKTFVHEPDCDDDSPPRLHKEWNTITSEAFRARRPSEP